jgi:hypothetical protein
MTKIFKCAIAATVMTVDLAMLVQPAIAQQTEHPPSPPRVRSSNTTIASLIARGLERSSTFHALVEAINLTNGIVYVEQGSCRSAAAGCLVAVHKSGPNRLVMIKITLGRPDADVIPTIAHELRHALEVLGDSDVTSSAAMYMFYLRAGVDARPGRFETAAAIVAGDTVHAELRRSAKAQH